MVDTQLYLWIKTMHIAFMVTWFSGLFYLPRLFVYHAMTEDQPGLALLYLNPTLLEKNRVIIKLSLVAILWIYHLLCGHYYKKFKENNNKMSHVFFRFFNEFPVIILITVIYLVIVKPNL